MERPVKWKAVASALHLGALNHCETFKSTKDAIGYLCSYGREEQSLRSTTISRKHNDFYYHPDNLPGPVGLSRFFSSGEVYCPCVLCEYVSVTSDGDLKCCTNLISRRSFPHEDLDQLRLEHLAVVHTPYFVMLFLELVQNKAYTFHNNGDALRSHASYVIKQLRGDVRAVTNEEESFRFLKLWWMYQDRRSSKVLKVSIPSYLELHTGNISWNPRHINFNGRIPVPLDTYLARNCLCHDIWSCGKTSNSEASDPSPRIITLTEGQVSTSMLSVPILRLHVEDMLCSVARACNERRVMCHDAGQPTAATSQMDCSSQLEPRLD